MSGGKKKWIGGGIPYGYRFDENNNALVIDEIEAEVLRTIFQLSNTGFGVNKIANELNKKSIRPRRGREWTSSIISYILSPRRLKYYLGIDKDNTEGAWPPLLDLKLYNQLTQEANKLIVEKKLKEKPGEKYLLTGIGVLKCGYCKGNVKASVTTRDETKIRYYLCSRKQNAGKVACIESKLHRQEKINELVLKDLKNTTSLEMFNWIVRKSDLLKEQYQSEVINIFNIISKQFKNTVDKDPRSAVGFIEDGFNAIKEVQRNSENLRIPEEFNYDDPQRSIIHNIKEIFLYNNEIKIVYYFPIHENLSDAVSIDLNNSDNLFFKGYEQT